MCGSHEWNKEVLGYQIRCPECDATWEFEKMPIYFITGCSGIGKTTTGKELIKLSKNYVFLDADMFYNIMPHETEEDYYNQVEQILSLSKNIMQSGKPVVWMMAGNIDKITKAYHARFFDEICVLALTCDMDILRRRMREGRGIDEEAWINSSIEYNEYFRSHSKLGDLEFETLDIGNSTPYQAAFNVLKWLNSKKK